MKQILENHQQETSDERLLEELNEAAGGGMSPTSLQIKANELGLCPELTKVAIEKGINGRVRNSSLQLMAYGFAFAAAAGFLAVALESPRSLLLSIAGFAFFLFGLFRFVAVTIKPTRLNQSTLQNTKTHNPASEGVPASESYGERFTRLLNEKNVAMNSKLAWFCGLGSIFIVTIPATVFFYFLIRYFLNSNLKKVMHMVQTEGEHPHWADAEIRSVNGFEQGVLIVRSKLYNGKERKTEVPVNVGDIPEVLECLQQLCPETEIGGLQGSYHQPEIETGDVLGGSARPEFASQLEP